MRVFLAKSLFVTAALAMSPAAFAQEPVVAPAAPTAEGGHGDHGAVKAEVAVPEQTAVPAPEAHAPVEGIPAPADHAVDHAAMGHEMPSAHGDAAHGAAADHGGGHHEDPSLHYNFFEGLPFGYPNKDALGGPLGDGKMGVGDHAVAVEHEEKMNAPFILMVFNFAILMLLLAKFAGPAARKAAETRSDTIKNALEESARLRKEAAAKLDEYKTKLADADKQIAKMVEDMRASAEADKARTLAAADAQAAAMKRDAEARIAAEIDRARAMLKQEVAAAAAAAAEKVMRERANASDHTKLVDTFIADLMRAPAGGANKENR